MIILGSKVKDSITGFEGIAIAKVIYLNGCISYQVKSQKLYSGKTLDAEWFDEQNLMNQSKAIAGGPQDRPPEMHP